MISEHPEPSGILPEDLDATLRVLEQMSDIDETHPDFVRVRQATAKMFKAVKRAHRLEKRAVIAEADRLVIAATATGAADRIDDETRGVPISTSTTASTATASTTAPAAWWPGAGPSAPTTWCAGR